jgi:hypothetical protein
MRLPERALNALVEQEPTHCHRQIRMLRAGGPGPGLRQSVTLTPLLGLNTDYSINGACQSTVQGNSRQPNTRSYQSRPERMECCVALS